MFGIGKKKEIKQHIVMPSCVFNCGKEKCPKWVVMYHKINDQGGKVHEEAEGKCGEAWTPTMLVELRLSVDRLAGLIAKMIPKE